MLETATSRTRNELRGLLTDGNGRILAIVSVGWFFSVGIRFTYPILLPFFQAEFGITLATAGLLVSGLWVAYAFGQFPGGILGDRFGEGNILVASTLLSVIGITTVAISSRVSVLFAGTVAFGFATALYGPTRFTMLTDVYDEQSGTAIGVTMAAGSIGNTVLPLFAGLIGSYITWRFGFGILIPIFLGITLASWFVLPRRTSDPVDGDAILSVQHLEQLVTAIKKPGVSIVVSVQVCATFATQGLLSFYPTYLINVKNLSPNIAAVYFSMYFAIGIAVQPMAGMGRDRFGPRKTLVLLLAISYVSLVVLQFVHGLVLVGTLTILLSSQNGIPVINNTYLSSSLPEVVQGSGLGLLRTAWILIGAASPVVVGFLANIGYFEEAFLLLAVFAGVATLLAGWVPE